MGTAYKYVERAADDQINWAEVGSNFSNTLKAEAELRERKKAAIDEASREYQKVLLDVPQGENSGQNKFALDAADTLTQQALIQNTLLKSGQLDPRRYMITRQNMVDGTEAAFSMFEDYNAKYKEINSLRAQNLPYGEQLSALGEYSMASIEGFGNFHQTQMVVNPNNGIVSMAKMIPDPSYKGSGEAPLVPDLNNLMTVASMKNRTKGRILKFDVIGSAEGFIGSLGKDKRVFMENIGSKYTAAIFKTVSDASQKVRITDMPDEELQSLATRLSTPEKPVTVADLKEISLYTEAKKNYIEGQMVGDNAAASTLVDYKAVAPSGKTYEIMETTPENLALRDAEDGSGSHIILVKNQNGMMVPNLTEDQKADASRALDVAIDSGMDYEETVATAFTGKEPRARTPTETAYSALQKQQQTIMSNFGMLWYGNDTQAKEAEDYLRGLNTNILEFDRDGSSVTVEFKDGTSETLAFYDDAGALIDQASFIKGGVNKVLSEKYKITDIDGTLAQSKYNRDAVFNDESVAFSAVESQDKKESLNASFSRVIRGIKPITSGGEDIFVTDNVGASIPRVQNWISSIPGLGGKYTVVKKGWPTDDRIQVKDSDDNVVAMSPEFSNEGEDFSGFYNAIYKLAENLTSEEDVAMKIMTVQGKTRTVPGTGKRTSKKQEESIHKKAQSR